MSRWTPCKRGDFVRRVHRLGFDGPFVGGRHEFMVYKQHRLAIPSNDEYSVPQIRVLIRELEAIVEFEITLEDWNKLV